MNEINYKNINSLQEAKELILKCFNTNDFTNLKNIFINYADTQKLL